MLANDNEIASTNCDFDKPDDLLLLLTQPTCEHTKALLHRLHDDHEYVLRCRACRTVSHIEVEAVTIVEIIVRDAAQFDDTDTSNNDEIAL